MSLRSCGPLPAIFRSPVTWKVRPSRQAFLLPVSGSRHRGSIVAQRARQDRHQQPGKPRLDIGRPHRVLMLNAFLAGLDQAGLAQHAKMVRQGGLGDGPTWRCRRAGQAATLLQQAPDDLQPNGISQRRKHAGQRDVLGRGVNELNHEKNIGSLLRLFNSPILPNY